MDIIVNSIEPICKEHISRITLKKVKKNNLGGYTAGSVKPGPDKIVLREVPNTHFADYIHTIHHEFGHIIDHKTHNKPWGVSNSNEWKEAFKLDKKHNIKSNNKEIIENGYFVSEYAKDKAEEYTKDENLKKVYAEDFADSVKYYLKKPKTFKRSSLIEVKLLKNI